MIFEIVVLALASTVRPTSLAAVSAWFALPIAALVLCIVSPDAAQTVVLAAQATTKRHSRTIVLVTCFGVGAALLLRGLLAV
jgi:hypothetical protein